MILGLIRYVFHIFRLVGMSDDYAALYPPSSTAQGVCYHPHVTIMQIGQLMKASAHLSDKALAEKLFYREL